jgi:hypothetical protein
VGYGAALGGVAPLLAVLSSCSAGVAVVNVDSGFGAAMAAYRIAPTIGGQAPLILWLDPFSGISGDMLLGALLDLGAPLDGVRAAVTATGLTGWELTAEPVRQGALAATRARVIVHDTATSRPAAELLAMVGRAGPADVAGLATRAVRALPEVEGGLHGVPADAVHLHEIGGSTPW